LSKRCRSSAPSRTEDGESAEEVANGPGGHGANTSHDVGLVGDGASAVAPSNGQGGFKANQRATLGIATAGVFVLPHLHPAPQPKVFHASSHGSGYHASRSALATIYARSRIRTSENPPSTHSGV